ncbi:DUF7594 domain-containing protein [Sphingobacterium kitahiroshimense]|uniref:DNRLRE domain-containing protein n=1 Tax=Sphingobacterium kitahiroshimense TaxID=470446 RepID=A0ABV0BVP7_9SPHI
MKTMHNKYTIPAMVLLTLLSTFLGCKREIINKLSFEPDIPIETDLLPIADAYVQDGENAGTNYGNVSYLVAKDDQQNYRREIYLRFDLTTLPEPISNIQSAHIELHGGVADASDTANAKWVYYTTKEKNWNEKTITWNNAPQIDQQIGELNGKYKGDNQAVSFEIPNSVLKAAINADKKISIKIIAQQQAPGLKSFYSDFRSKETQDVKLQPRLKINYTAAPSSYYSNVVMDKITFDSIQHDIATSEQARTLLRKQLTTVAEAALSSSPTPVNKISDPDARGKVQADAAKIYALALQYFLFQKEEHAKQYVDKAKEFLLSWAAINIPIDHPPQESVYLPFFTGYSLIRAQIDSDSRAQIDTWLKNRYDFYKIQPLRPNNWETMRNLLMLDIAYILDDEDRINQAKTDFDKHHNTNYRADGASVDFLGRDAFAYHIYDMEFAAQIGRTLYIKEGRSVVDNFVNHRSTKWINLRIDPNDPPVLGGSMADAVSFMAPYVMDPERYVHLEFVNTEYAPDKNREDYNKPYRAAGSTYAFVQVAAVMKEDMLLFLKKISPSFNRYTDLRYYINSFGPSFKPSPATSATLYGKYSYRGWFKELELGKYSQSELAALGIIDNGLSSISIPKGLRCILYDNGDFTGNSITLTGNNIDLSKFNFNDTMSSLVIEKL